jgi:putative transposase
MRGRFSEAQILDFLRAAATGTPVMELCWNHCFSRSAFRVWKSKYGAKYGDTIAPRGERLAQLERENAQLRKALRKRANRPDADFDRRRSPHPLTCGRS